MGVLVAICGLCFVVVVGFISCWWVCFSAFGSLVS